MSMGGLDPAISPQRTTGCGRRRRRGRSPAYVTLSSARWPTNLAILDFLGTLPPGKRRPNLLFASAYYLLGASAGPPHRLRDAGPTATRTLADAGDAGPAHPDQRGRPLRHPAARARAATRAARADRGRRQRRADPAVRPLLLRLRRPRDHRLGPGGADAALRPRGPVPLPARVPEIAWRAGLDLNPLDVTSDDDVALAVVPALARRGRPRAAPRGRDRHGPPLPSPGPPRRPADRPARPGGPAPRPMRPWSSTTPRCWPTSPPTTGSVSPTVVGGLAAVWLSNEAPGVVASVPESGRDDGTFVLGRDGRQALARTDGHGDWVEWLAH